MINDPAVGDLIGLVVVLAIVFAIGFNEGARRMRNRFLEDSDFRERQISKHRQQKILDAVFTEIE